MGAARGPWHQAECSPWSVSCCCEPAQHSRMPLHRATTACVLQCRNRDLKLKPCPQRQEQRRTRVPQRALDRLMYVRVQRAACLGLPCSPARENRSHTRSARVWRHVLGLGRGKGSIRVQGAQHAFRSPRLTSRLPRVAENEPSADSTAIAPGSTRAGERTAVKSLAEAVVASTAATTGTAASACASRWTGRSI